MSEKCWKIVFAMNTDDQKQLETKSTSIIQDAGSIGRSADEDSLEYMAFCGQSERVHAIFKRIPKARRKRYTSKYVLHQVVCGGIARLRKLSNLQANRRVDIERAFINEVVEQFLDICRARENFPREFFQALLIWSNELDQLSLPDEALRHARTAIRSGSSLYPDLHVQFLGRMARIARDSGKLMEAYSILSSLARRPYLISDRNLIPGVLFDLGQTALVTGYVDTYKKLLFKGLRFFYTSYDDRRRFFDQIRKTYRNSYRVLTHNEVSTLDKALFLVHWLYFRTPNMNRAYLGFIDKTLWYMLLGIVYGTYYLGRNHSQWMDDFTPHKFSVPDDEGCRPSLPTNNTRTRPGSNLLITRAMGGIGDLLMMTPGIHALHRKFPDDEIFLAIPRRYFPLFENNGDVTLLDIDDGPIDYSTFRMWYNLTDCPASRFESFTAPRVRKNRIDIFARALGIRGTRLWKMNRRPRYFLSDEDTEFRERFWTNNDLKEKEVIGLQLHAGEPYRDYPHMGRLIGELAKERTVLLFGEHSIHGHEDRNVIKIDTRNLQQLFALASGSDLLVCPDSAFVHLAGALGIPCVALFGPIDGKIRTAQYPSVEYLDIRTRLGCIPCWRNEIIPCKLTDSRVSVCMGEIPVQLVVDRVNKRLRERHGSAE